MALSQKEIDELLENTKGAFAPTSSSIGYIPRFAPEPYSAENLPEFMRRSYTQIPGVEGYVAKSGLLRQVGLPPFDPFEGDVQSLFAPNYNQRAAELEQKFQQEMAIQPEMFSKTFTPGYMIPRLDGGTPDSGTDEALAIGTVGKLMLPEITAPEITAPELDVNIETPEINLPDIDTNFEFGTFEPPKISFPPFGPIDPPDIDFGLDVDLPDVDINLPDVDVDLPDVDVDLPDLDLGLSVAGLGLTLPDFDLDGFDFGGFDFGISDKIKDIIPEGLGTAKDAFESAQDVKDAFDDPHAKNTLDAIEGINDRYDTQVLPGEVAGALTDISAVIGIGNALDDPSVSNLAKGYEDLVYLVDNSTDTILPGSDVAGTVGSIAAGLEALEGGIDTPEEALKVAAGANDIYGVTQNLKSGMDVGSSLSNAGDSGFVSGDAIGSAGAIIGGLAALEGGVDSVGEAVQVGNAVASVGALMGSGAAATALTFLGPIGAVIAVADLLDVDPILDVFGMGDDGSLYGNAVLGRKEDGTYKIESESSKNKGFKNTIPEAHTAGVILNELEQSYGFEFNEDKWKDVNARVDFDSGATVRTANDVVIDALEKGALVPTATTPVDLDFESIFSSARDAISKAGDRAWKSSSTNDFYITRRDYAGEAAELLKEAGISDSDLAMAAGPIDLGLGGGMYGNIQSNVEDFFVKERSEPVMLKAEPKVSAAYEPPKTYEQPNFNSRRGYGGPFRS